MITRNGIGHFADIYANKGLVVLLQNSPISCAEIIEREKFYGEKMIWIINGMLFEKNFHFSTINHYSQLPIFIAQEEGHYLSKKKNFNLYIQNWNILNKDVRDILWRHGFNGADPLGRLYKKYFSYKDTIDARSAIIKDIEDTFGKQTPEEELTEVRFAWDNRRDCWDHSERSIFMDFGKDYLVWFHSSKRNSIKSGEAKKMLKSHFISKINEK